MSEWTFTPKQLKSWLSLNKPLQDPAWREKWGRLHDYARLVRLGDYITFTETAGAYLLSLPKVTMEHISFLIAALLILGPGLYGGLYALNDAQDHERDRLHPVKSQRPVAAGRISPSHARRLGWSMLGIGLFAAALVDVRLLLIALVFVILNTSYTYFFKKIPYLEIVLNTATHSWRLLAGMWLAGHWQNLEVVWVGTLAVFCLSTLKRLKELNEAPLEVRPALRYYTRRGLQTLVLVSLAATVLAYFLTSNGIQWLANLSWSVAPVGVAVYFFVPKTHSILSRFWQ